MKALLWPDRMTDEMRRYLFDITRMLEPPAYDDQVVIPATWAAVDAVDAAMPSLSRFGKEQKIQEVVRMLKETRDAFITVRYFGAEHQTLTLPQV